MAAGQNWELEDNGAKVQDSLTHYSICPHLFALWSFLIGEVSSDPLIRWGLVSPNQQCIQQIACVFSGYHAVRRHFKANHFFVLW